MRINTNVSALTALEANKQSNTTLSKSLERLSTGLRINKASDDASGLAIADKLRTQANGLNQAVSNGNSAVTLTQIADKAMAEQSNILDVIKQKLIQAGTATTSAEGIEAIAKDISKLMDQIDNIAKQTTYNGTELLQQAGSAINQTSAATREKALDTRIDTLRALSAGVTASAFTHYAGSAKAAANSASTTDAKASTAGTALTFQMGTTDADTIKTDGKVQATIAGLDGMKELKVELSQWGKAGSAAQMQSGARTQLENVDKA